MNHTRNRMSWLLCFAASLQIFFSTPLAAQENQPNPSQVAQSSAGQVGQRQKIEVTDVHFKPMRRIQNRIQNRIQSRISQRIDRSYNSSADAVGSFEVASEQIRQR